MSIILYVVHSKTVTVDVRCIVRGVYDDRITVFPRIRHTIDFVDIRCNEDITVRCENGGLLVRTEGGFACECTQHYTGENCTESKVFFLYIRVL